MSIILQKDSPFLQIFNYYLNLKREDGSLEKIMNSYKPSPQKCPDYSGKALSLYSCFTAFILIIFGLFISAIIFSLEYFGKNLMLDKMKNAETTQDIDSHQQELWKKEVEIEILQNRIVKLEQEIVSIKCFRN